MPKQLVTKVVFDQSVFVRNAIENLIHEGLIGLVLNRRDDFDFSWQHERDGRGVSLDSSCPHWRHSSRLSLGGSTINAMVLGGLALAFSRLIDNSVVVLENIFRHLELGEPLQRSPPNAADRKSRCRCSRRR